MLIEGYVELCALNKQYIHTYIQNGHLCMFIEGYVELCIHTHAHTHTHTIVCVCDRMYMCVKKRNKNGLFSMLIEGEVGSTSNTYTQTHIYKRMYVLKIRRDLSMLIEGYVDCAPSTSNTHIHTYMHTYKMDTSAC